MARTVADIQREKAGRKLAGHVRDKLTAAHSALSDVLNWADDGDGPDKEDMHDETHDMQAMGKSTFFVFKDSDGADRWVSFSSNAFEDREKEIVSTKAIEQDIAETDESGDYGPLRLFHVKGTDIGRCDFRALEGRFLIESGVFDNTRLADKAKAFFKSTDEPLGVSLGFMHPISALRNGIYTRIKTFERSVLPLAEAANPWTSFRAIQKGGLMDSRKSAWLTKMLGPDDANEIISAAQTATKELESRVSYKEAPEGEPESEPESEPEADNSEEKDFREVLAYAIDAIPDEEKRKAFIDTFEAEFPAPVPELPAEQQGLLEAMKALIQPLVERMDSIEGKVKASPGAPDNIQDFSPRGSRMHRASEDTNNLADKEAVDKVVKENVPEDTGDKSPASQYLGDVLNAWRSA